MGLRCEQGGKGTRPLPVRTIFLLGVLTLPSALGLAQLVGHEATGVPPSPPSPSPLPLPPASPHFTFAHGTFQPPSSGSALGCADLDDQLSGLHLAEAIDVCFDPQFSCSDAEPFVGMAMIRGVSEGDPQTGEQASIQIEGTDSWLPALVPVHAPRGSRRTTTPPVPVVGCLIDHGSRFVLSWADVRCRSLGECLVSCGVRWSRPTQCGHRERHGRDLVRR